MLTRMKTFKESPFITKSKAIRQRVSLCFEGRNFLYENSNKRIR
jgi:hypothetical protein